MSIHTPQSYASNLRHLFSVCNQRNGFKISFKLGGTKNFIQFTFNYEPNEISFCSQSKKNSQLDHVSLNLFVLIFFILNVPMAACQLRGTTPASCVTSAVNSARETARSRPKHCHHSQTCRTQSPHHSTPLSYDERSCWMGCIIPPQAAFPSSSPQILPYSPPPHLKFFHTPPSPPYVRVCKL